MMFVCWQMPGAAVELQGVVLKSVLSAAGTVQTSLECLPGLVQMAEKTGARLITARKAVYCALQMIAERTSVLSAMTCLNCNYARP